MVKVIITVILTGATVVAASVCDYCKKDLSDYELEQGYCDDCDYLIPKPQDENGIAVFEFVRENWPFEFDPEDIFVEIINNDTAVKYHAKILSAVEFGQEGRYLKFTNINSAFKKARKRHLQLFLKGRIVSSAGCSWVSVHVFDIETGCLVYEVKASFEETNEKYVKSKFEDTARALVSGLPYRGRSADGQSTFEIPSPSPEATGGRVEIYDSYAYPSGKYRIIKRRTGLKRYRNESEPDVEFEPECFLFDIGDVKPVKVITASNGFSIKPGDSPDSFRMTDRNAGPGFRENAICYYYPPEIPPVKERWFGSIGLSYGWHDYSYAEDMDSVERAGGARLSFGRRFKFGLPSKFTVGLAADIPANYRYDYGGVYEGRGRIMGAYVGSVNAGYDVHVYKEWGFLPWFGVGVDYFSPLGHGVYEQEGGGLEPYFNDLWTGLLIGPRVDWEVPFYLGQRKQTRVFIGGGCYWPVLGEHKKHFGPLVRIPFGFRYYF